MQPSIIAALITLFSTLPSFAEETPAAFVADPQRTSELALWCDQVVPALGRAQTNAMRRQFAGDSPAALRVLQQGMRDALAQAQTNGAAGTISARLLARGLLVSAHLQAQFPNEDHLPAQLNFVSAWINLVIRTATSLDQEFYIPFSRRIDYAGYQQGLLGIIGDELSLLTDSLANGSLPLGSAPFFLRATHQVLAAIIHEDLNAGLYAYRFACLTNALQALQTEIATNEPSSHLVWSVLHTLRDLAPRLGSVNCR